MKLNESPFLSSEVLTAKVNDGSTLSTSWVRGGGVLLSSEADAWILTQGQNLTYLELTSGSKDLDQRATNPEIRWVLQDARPGRLIGRPSPMLYGQFLEHFHRQIYGGVFDPTHPLADEDGFRTDVLDALRGIRVPIIRWPGRMISTFEPSASTLAVTCCDDP